MAYSMVKHEHRLVGRELVACADPSRGAAAAHATKIATNQLLVNQLNSTSILVKRSPSQETMNATMSSPKPFKVTLEEFELARITFDQLILHFVFGECRIALFQLELGREEREVEWSKGELPTEFVRVRVRDGPVGETSSVNDIILVRITPATQAR